MGYTGIERALVVEFDTHHDEDRDSGVPNRTHHVRLTDGAVD